MMPYVSSSSSSRLSQGYDVFMSFRGEDTRAGFTSHLYDALIRNDITTYKDDKTLEIGNPIASELLEAIEASRIAIVILSNTFATSKWCLEEIAKIVKCKEQGELTVIPVFYHVDPSDVRRQGNCFHKGFSDHEANPEIAPQNVERWRDAFRKVGALSGFHVTQHRNEAEVVSEIVKLILKNMPDTLPIDVTNGLVGIDSRMDEVISLMRMESSEVLFIGICGMSGIGKTTLAEAVFNNLKNKYDKSSFIENIKDISKQDNSTDLCKLQQKLLDDILKEKSVRVRSVKHGQTLLGTKLLGLKVMIVLDDVNHADQLSYLAGGRQWFGPGTRIIVTTTNIHLLNVHKVNEIYRCEEMKNDEALRLFIQSAFEHGPPTQVYEQWSDDIVKLAGGLPLALNVYGSLLHGKEENYWKEMLKKLREYPPEDVLGRLEVVFARLDSNQQDTFMYIACFLKGSDVDLVKDILKDIGFTLSESSTIRIINQEKVEMDDSIDDSYCFSIMRRLKFLRISNVCFPQGLSYLSNDLRILEWFECSLKSLPSNFKPTHMYELEMCYSQLKTLWEETLVFPNLRSIDLSFSKELIKIPDLTSTPKLVKLNLQGCTNLKELHESVLLQKSLQYVYLTGCTHLQSLGRKISNMEWKSIRLQSLPKLSIVNEDTLSGLPIRFSYIISREEVDVSKFHATSNNTNPTISCLNCPNLSKSGRGSYLAENLLHSYLQLRTKCWMTPVAVFEIVGAGSDISPGFVLPGTDDLILKSPWIGVAICAIIAVDNIDAFMEDKYVITAQIHVGEKHWRISVPVNFFVGGLENQLVIYWTVADDLERILDSKRQYNLHVSFSVEPGEGNDDPLSAKHQWMIKGLANGKAVMSNLRDIQVKDIVKEVEDYLKTYSSAEMDIRWCVEGML
ncbi:NB-ARC domains-containing protein [Tanacetum coccineum]